MRKLVIVIAVATLLWSGYWVVGSQRASNGVRDWLAARQVDGWDVSIAGVRTRGFPNRLDTTLTAPDLSLPNAGIGWSAPFFQILRLSYKPEHAILIFPNSQTLTLAGQPVALSSTGLQASVVFGRDETQALDRANLVADTVSLVSAGGATATLGKALAAIRKAQALAQTYDLALDFRNVVLPVSDDRKPLVLGMLRLDATATFGTPLTLSAPMTGGPDVIELDLQELHARSENFDLVVTGTLTFDSDGAPSGTLTLQTKSWPDLLGAATALGLLTKAQAALAVALPNDLGSEVRLDIRRGAVSFEGIQLR